MKKPTILRTLIFAVAMLFNFVSHSQNLIAFDSKFDKNLNENVFFKAANQFENSISLSDKKETSKIEAVAELDNPIIPYAELPYAGQVVKCPNDGKKLPKLFLCGGNDSRPIDIKITDAQSIVWERFISGGGCVTVSNSDCANETAAASCWKQVGTGKDYLANTAGQFRVKIVDKAGVPSVFYFNVYQNTLIPTAVTKSDIIKSSDGSCKIDGKITVGGFGNGYEYSFTTTGAPGQWDVNNTFTTSTPGNYTAFIRIKDVVGSCEFKVINLDIKNLTFQVKTSFASPKCSGDLGSVQVITNDIKQDYKYEIFKVTGTTSTLLNYSPFTKDSEYPFSGLAPGNYRVITSIGTGCMKETNNFTIAAPAAKIIASATLTDGLTACNDKGIITVSQNGGTAPYQYFVSTDGGTTFVANGTSNTISIVKAGSYIIRVEDVNGCSALTSPVPVNDPLKPIYEIIATDGNCNGGLGQIEIKVSNANGYTMSYTFEGGNSGSIIKNLDPGNYLIGVKYSKTVKGTTTNCSDPVVSVAIGGKPALTASAGVAELAGCGPVGNEKQGKVRITNAEGGTAPYKYSFDLKKTWIDLNWAYIDPVVDHKVYVKDNAGCIFEMSGITLKPKPNEPTIKIDDPVFNCDGTATTTVTVTNDVNSEFSYNYFIDGTANTPIDSNVFKNVSQGDHTIMVNYTVKTVPTYSNLLVETFGSGPDVTSPGINTFYYKWERQVVATQENGSIKLNDGEYTVTANIVSPHGTWLNPQDHTTITGTRDLRGRYLAVNIGDKIPTSAILYQKEIKDVIADQPISVKISAINLLRTGQNGANPNIQLALVDLAGNDVSSVATGAILKTNKWEDYLLTLNPGKNTNLKFVVRSNVQEVDGNDVAIDDITVFQMPKICGATALFPIVVDGSKAFSAGITGYKDVRCSGEQNGEITLSAKNFDPKKGFQYLIAGDPAGWQTVKPVPAATSGSITLKNLASKIYNISIRYDDTAGSCSFPVAQEIKSPKKLKVDAWVEQVLKCSAGAIIKAKASDGTPGYKYELRETDGVTVVKAFQDSDTFLDIKITGNYKVVAKDLNDCETEVLASVDIVAPVRPKLENVTPSVCFDKNAGTNITIKVTDGVPNYTYTVKYNGGNPVGPSATFAGPTFTYKAENEGSYEFIVTDSFGCSSDPITQVITAQLLAATPVTTPLDCDVAPANRAVITGTIEGGKAPFTITITTGDKTGDLVGPTTTGNTFTYTTAVAGDYTFTIKDANNCTTTSDAKINALVAVTGSVVKATDPSCHDGATGQVQLSGGGGTGKGYEFSFNGSGFSPTSLYTTLNANTTTANTTVYKYQVKDSNGCLSPIYDVTLNNPTLVVASADFPANTACSDAVIITVTGNGGAGGYTYSFNGSTTYTDVRTLTVNLTTAVQTIKYSVQDSKGCISNKTIDVPAYNPPTGITFSTPAAITCMPGKTTTSVTLTPKAGGVAPFTYLITVGTGTGTSNNDGIFSGLTAGNYTFQITDANGCSKTASIEIDPAVSISVSGKKTDVKCVGATNGTATFTITGASAVDNFTYVLTPASGAVTQLNDVVKVTGLAVGTYKLQVKDKTTGCFSNEASVTIDPATAITITGVTASNVNCNNSISNIVVTATGGVPNYKYAYVIAGTGMPDATAFSDTNTTINTGTTQSNLFWDVYVMDQNDCTAVFLNKEIFRDASPSLKTPAPAPFCFTAPSTTSVDARTFFNLGTGTHTYTVNGTAIGGGGTNFNITASGIYRIIVKDANGCTATAIYDIKPQLSIVATRVKDFDCNSAGEITFEAFGGSATYSTYEVQFNGAGAWSTVASPYNTSTPGDYTFKVTDNAGCSAISNKITITSNPKPTFSHNETLINCNNGSDGVINITNPTGTAPFSYLITKGGLTVSTTSSATGLSAGRYDIVVKDGKGCTSDPFHIDLANPAVLTATVNATTLACNTDGTTKGATITVTLPSGGTNTGFEYSFNGGAFSGTASYTTTNVGLVTVDMRDSNKCVQSLTSPKILALDPPKITGFTGSDITCKIGEDKSNVDVAASNGSGALTYTIVSGPTSNTTGATDGKFTGLADGTYFFKVTDEKGCSDTKPYTVKPLVNIAASLLSQVNVKCNGSSTGSAIITVSAFAGTYTAALTVGTGTVLQTGSTVDVTVLKAGLYTLRVTDDKTSCTKDVNFTITESTPLTLVEATNKNASCSQPLSKVSVTAGGGKSPYSYAFRSTTGKPAAGDYVLNKNTADLDPAITTWYAWVKDANDCETPVTITLAKDPDVEIALPNQQCFVGTPFNIILSEVTGTGIGPFTYTVNGATIPNDKVAGLPIHTATYSITATGTYKLGIKDANNCTNFKDYVVEKQLVATAVPDKDLTCSLPADASITVTITNGTAPFSYQIYDGSTKVGLEVKDILTNTFTEKFATSGNYSFEIKDVNGCPVKTNAVLVNDTTPIVMSPVVVSKPILCSGYSTAEIKVTYDNTQGTGPFKINVSQYSEIAHTNLVKDFGTQVSSLPAGFYVVTVTDSKGCFAKESAIIDPVAPINVSFKGNDITCVSGSGLSKGSIVVNSVTGGSGKYTYQVSNDTGYVSPLVSATGGAYTFDLINFGNYQLKVIDENNCSWIEQNILIASPPENLELVVTPTTPACGAKGSVEIAVATALAGPLEFFFAIYKPGILYTAGDPDWYPESGLNSLKTTIPNLTPGVTYTFIVYDSNTKCYYFKTFVNTVPSNSSLTGTGVAVPIQCADDTNGSVNLKIVSTYSVPVDVSYEIFNSATMVTTGIKDNGVVPAQVSLPLPVVKGVLDVDNFGFTPGLPYGTYYVLITETSGPNAGCAVTTVPFSITKSAKTLSITATSSKNGNTCVSNAGVITAEALEGTGPYQFAIVDDAAGIPTTFSSESTFFKDAGKYDVYVKDAYGCIKKADVEVPLDPAPAILSITPSATCYVGNLITVTVAAKAPILSPVTYSVDKGLVKGAYGNSASFDLAPGTYQFNIKDGNGCTDSAPFTIRERLTLSPTLTKELDCKTVAPNATVTVKAEGGDNTKYAYTITAGTTINVTGATSGIFTGLAAGDYTFEVSDGVCTATTEITIDDLVPIVPAKLEINPLCIGDNGSVEISATGGVGPYTYQKGTPPTLITETINKFVQTAAELTVTYYVRDSKGCVEEIKATVVDPPVITIASVVTNQLTCGSGNSPNEATITVTATGGTGTLQYSFDNGIKFSENPVFTTTASGTYHIIVKDENDCKTTMRPEDVLALDPPKITRFVKTQMTCPALLSDVTVEHSNGVGTLSFKIISGTTINTTGDISGTYTGLAAGDYVFRITDGNNCTAEDTFTVPGLPTLQLQPQVVSNVGCITDKTGNATFTASNLFASGAFSYTVATVPTGLTFTDTKLGDVVTLANLGKGQYDVTIKDNTTLCEITKSVTITEPLLALSIDAVASNVNCNDPISQLTMSPLGGSGNYKYSIVQSGTAAGTFSTATSIDTSLLTNGVVSANGLGMTWLVDVHVQDANNCPAMKTITITKDDTPTVTTPTLTGDQCTANGSYTFTATGTGVGPLRFSIDDVNYFESASGSYTFTVPVPTTASKTYTVYLKDKNGCPVISTTSTTVYKPLTLNVVQDKDITCAAMPVTGAQFTLTAAGGNPGYTYEVDINGGGFNPITTPYTTNITGDYTFRVTDMNSCKVVSDVIKIDNPATPAFTTSKVDVKCTGDYTGTITVTPSGGVGPYTFALSGVGSNTTGDATGLYTGLPKGSYNVVVTDHYGCTSLAVPAIVIAEPIKLSVTPTVSKNTSCSPSTLITLEGHDGTPDYRYSFDNGNTYDKEDHITVDLNGPVQTIWYSVIDANGCKTPPVRIDIDPLNKPNKLDFSATVITCKTGEDVSTVDVKATNGVGPLVFEIISTNTATAPALFGPITTPDSATAASFPGLLPGTYTFKVTDDNKCSYQDSFTIASKINILADGQLVAGVACKGESNGKVTFKVSKIGALGFTHTISGVSGVGVVTLVGTDTFELTNLAKGTYKIDVKDNATDCISSFSVDVPEPETLKVEYVTNKHANCDNGAEITATATFGTAGYKYAFVKAGDPKVYTDSDTAILDKAFTWVVWAKDAHDCEISAPITIIVDPMPSITSAIPTQCPSTAGTYDIPVIASGFTPNLEYSLDRNSWGTNNILVVKTTGNHTVYVRDENKCEISRVVNILEPLKLLYDITGNPTCNGNQGEVTLIPSGGTVTPSYEYTKDNWVNTQTTPVFSGLTPGKYTFSVRDRGTNCTKDVEVVFEIPNLAIDFSLTPSKVLCNNGSTGSITVNMAAQTATVNNNPVYTYAINPSPIGMVLVGNVFTNLPKGRYIVTVTSGKGCPVDKIIDVEEPLAITVPNPDVVEFGCTKVNNANDATITVGLPSGGSNDYKVYEFLKNGNPIPVQRGDNPVYIESDLLGGNYVINVYDTNGCLGTTTAVIKPFVAIDFATPSAITVTKAITCINDEDIQVNVTTTGTTTPMPVLVYNLKGISAGSTIDIKNNDGAFTGLTIGNYLVTVTNPITGCTITMIHYVNDPNTFDLVASNIKNVICYGTATGSVDLNFVDNQVNPDEAGPFEYTITGPKGTSPLQTTTGVMITIPNLEAGFYTVKAKLSATPSCEVETSFSIAEPTAALSISVNSTPISCDPGNDGTITVGAEGGWPGSYLYELVGVGPGAISVAYSQQFYFENLTPGSYTVNVKDLSGCVQTETLTLKTPDAILVTANATVSALLCNGDTSGVITVDLPTGGQGTNYSYILNYLSVVPVVSSAPQSQPVFSGLAAGTYSVTVVDGLNCVSQPSANLVINEPSKVEAELKLATGITCKTSATLTLSATGGTGQYEYSTDKTFAAIAGQFSSSVTFAVGLGDHQYYVRDSRGCIGAISNNITINPVTPLDLKLDLINAVVYCKGSSTAVIDAEAVGGLGNYIYTLLDSAGGIVRPAQPTGYFDLLQKGVYVVRVDSGDCQFSSQAVTINEPAEALSAIPTVTDVTCFGADDGKIVIAATGGTGVIQYAISPNLGLFDTKSVFDHLVPGLYQIIVQDENSCFQIIEREIKEPTVLEAKVVGPIIQEICDGDKDGAFTIEITGGKPPYSISLDNENGAYAPVIGTQHSFANLKGGAHKVFVKDATCLTSRDVIMDKAVVLDPITEVSYHCVNNAQANMVVVKINDSNDIADVDYSLDGTGTYQPSNVFMNVAPGTHFIVARHTNGCETQTTSFKIVSYEPLALTLAEDKGVWNIIKATATGGGGDYEYSIDGVNFSTKNEFKIYKTGTYTITVRDKNGCTVSQDYYIKYIDVCLDNYFTPNGDGVYDTWGPGCTNIYDKLEFSIFDRYGRTIAKYHYGQKWDGRYNGAELPSGDYWYVLKLNDENDAREFVGHFTLYR
ncbi:T9SS type B sorting domain-containing protein [Flavobacterium plurextorum]|nr:MULTISPECIES: T9SS type B sorting domain-containing protein [Flavobacterium]UUW10071.1 T9SS type B sorting domain-containing protein [Flavobacterium plurextorum]